MSSSLLLLQVVPGIARQCSYNEVRLPCQPVSVFYPLHDASDLLAETLRNAMSSSRLTQEIHLDCQQLLGSAFGHLHRWSVHNSRALSCGPAKLYLPGKFRLQHFLRIASQEGSAECHMSQHQDLFHGCESGRAGFNAANK